MPAPHFACELLATADALRHLREQVRFAVDHNDARVYGYPDAWLVLAHAVELAEAMESLAQRFGEHATLGSIRGQ